MAAVKLSRPMSRLNSALAGTSFGDAAGPVELDRLEQLVTVIRVGAGEQIVSAGAVGREAFIVLDGTFHVLSDAGIDVLLSAGAVVGEMALVTNTARNASVVAVTDATVAVLNRAEFSAMLADCPNIARHVLTAAVLRAQH